MIKPLRCDLWSANCYANVSQEKNGYKFCPRIMYLVNHKLEASTFLTFRDAKDQKTKELGKGTGMWLYKL